MTVLHTTRIRLEPIGDQHFDGIYLMDREPDVMRYITGRPVTRDQTAAWIAGVQRCWAAWGTGWWAFVEPSSGRIFGAGCVQYARREAVLPADLHSLLCNPLEIGWRLHPDFWHKGLASEAAQRMAKFAFEELGGSELIAFCHPDNLASARVIKSLRMHYRGMELWYGQPGATYVVSRKAWLEYTCQE